MAESEPEVAGSERKVKYYAMARINIVLHHECGLPTQGIICSFEFEPMGSIRRAFSIRLNDFCLNRSSNTRLVDLESSDIAGNRLRTEKGASRMSKKASSALY